MFIVDPGDMIFVPMFVWRVYPVEQILSNDIELMEIRLTKTEKVVQEELHDCNGNKDYIYGSKYINFSENLYSLVKWWKAVIYVKISISIIIYGQ